jgi:hypothetical protein
MLMPRATKKIEPTGLEWHKRWTTTGPPARRRRVVPSDVDGRRARRGPHALSGSTLTELEEARAGVALSRQLALDSLMVSEDVPDIEVLLSQLVSRPAWHR